MAKKAELLQEAKTLNLDVSEKDTIKEIESALLDARAEKGEPTIKAVAEEAVESTDATDPTDEVKVAKAGKRSAKALAEADEKAAKEEKKAGTDTTEDEAKPKAPVTPARPKIERAGKKLREAAKLVEKSKEYSIKEATELAIKTATTKFDSTVELHVRLNVDPKHADQNIRENIVLPAGTGKTIQVAVFGEPDDVAAAKKAGADIAGADEFLQQLDKGVVDFDVLIATPTVMVKLGKYARILGPKGLMPNPKSGTVTTDVAKAVEQARAGKVEVRVDETGIVHLGVGKVSFGTEKLMQNVQSVFASLKAAKPSSIKGNYVTSIYMSSTMGPSIRIASSEL